MKPVTTILKVGNATAVVVQLMIIRVHVALWINRTSSSIVRRYT